MKVLMVGASGRYAGLVVPELKKRGVTIRALIRSEDKAFAALKQGADETALGDLNDWESLREAARGVLRPCLAKPRKSMLVPFELLKGPPMGEAQPEWVRPN
jgi:uncharacterized protein YbjT (DUF2867 family)